MSIPDPDDCVFFINIKTGYVLQHLTAAIAKMEGGRIRINLDEYGVYFQSEKSTNKNDGSPFSYAMLDAYLESDKLERFVYNHPNAITIELTGKHLSDQFRKFKRKERAIMYILKGKKNQDTMYIYAESTVVKDVQVGVEHTITVSLYDKTIPFKDVESIEYATIEGVEDEHVYKTPISVDSSHFDRAKNVGGNGAFVVTIQDSRCIMFEKQNKNFYSGKVCIGKLDPKKPKYTGTFSSDIFDIIMILVKIKRPIVFYPPLRKYASKYPLKLAVPLEYVGTCKLFIKTTAQIDAESKSDK